MKYLKLLLSLTLFISFCSQLKAQNPGQGINGNIDEVTIANNHLVGQKIKLSIGTTTNVKYYIDMSRSPNGTGWHPVNMKVGLGYKEGNVYKFFDGAYTFKSEDFQKYMTTLYKELIAVVDHSKLPTGAKIYILYENHRPGVTESGWLVEAYALGSSGVIAYDFIPGTTTPGPGPGPGSPIVGVPPAFTAPEVGAVPLYEYVSGNRRRLTTVYYSSYPGFVYNGILGYVFASPTIGTIPLYRFVDFSYEDCSYDIATPPTSTGYRYDGIVCYVYQSHVPKTFPIYQSYSSSLGGFHRYSKYPEVFPNYSFDGAKFYILQNWPAASVPVYVFGQNNNDPNHIYTINRNDYPYEQHAFTYLGVNFLAYGSQVSGSQPVHVFTHDGDNNHIYTINRFDYPYESNGFKYQGVNFYAFTSQVSGTFPVHCFGRNGNANHVYTINKNDYPYEQNGFTYLGIAFYAFKP